MKHDPFIQLLIAGDLTRDFIIDLSGKAWNNIAGGSLLYAAAGARIWNESIGFLGRRGPDYPIEWLQAAGKRGFNTDGILPSQISYDMRRFYHWRDPNHYLLTNPVASYARFGIPFPKELLGYSPGHPATYDEMWSNISPFFNPTFPGEYKEIRGAHICPLNFTAHIKLQSLFQKQVINTITIAPSDDYMQPEFFTQIPAVIKDITALFPTEAQIVSLFQGRSKDLWEMAEALAEMGCPIIVILRGEKGFWLYDAYSKKRYTIPFYPTQWVDPTGAADVFAGAFLSRLKNSLDPLQAVIAGDVSASIKVEGTGVYYCLDRFPGIEQSRSEVLRSMIKVN